MRKLDETPLAASYTVKMQQVAKLADLAERLGKNKSEIVRMAIDHLYDEINRQEAEIVQPA